MAVKPDGDKVMMSFAIDKEIKAKAEAEAKKLGLNLSAFIRLALAEKLNK